VPDPGVPPHETADTQAQSWWLCGRYYIGRAYAGRLIGATDDNREPADKPSTLVVTVAAAEANLGRTRRSHRH